jgi:hypothetical protein
MQPSCTRLKGGLTEVEEQRRFVRKGLPYSVSLKQEDRKERVCSTNTEWPFDSHAAFRHEVEGRVKQGLTMVQSGFCGRFSHKDLPYLVSLK